MLGAFFERVQFFGVPMKVEQFDVVAVSKQ
jgi:hypothetical protein